MKENRFSTGSCLSILTPEYDCEIVSNTGSASAHLLYKGARSIRKETKVKSNRYITLANRWRLCFVYIFNPADGP